MGESSSFNFMGDNLNDEVDSINVTSGDILAQEVKKIRLRISDCYRNEILEPVFLKIWKIMLNTQYEPTLLKCVSHITHIPLKIEYYEIISPTF